jgi:hypothetical protein
MLAVGKSLGASPDSDKSLETWQILFQSALALPVPEQGDKY